MRRLTFTALILALLGLSAIPAGAGLGVPTYTFDPTSGPPGTVVTVSGICDDGEVIFFEAFGEEDPVEVGGAIPGPDGFFSGQILIPTDAIPGSLRHIGAQCDSEATQYIEFLVTAPPPPPPPTTATSTVTTATPASMAVAAAAASPRFTG